MRILLQLRLESLIETERVGIDRSNNCHDLLQSFFRSGVNSKNIRDENAMILSRIPVEG